MSKSSYDDVLTLIEMTAEVVRFDKSSRFVGIRMESVQVSADMFDRAEVLHLRG